MNMIIMPDKIEVLENKVVENRARYMKEPALKALADFIHETRLMSGPACDSCIALAVEKLENQKD